MSLESEFLTVFPCTDEQYECHDISQYVRYPYFMDDFPDCIKIDEIYNIVYYMYYRVGLYYIWFDFKKYNAIGEDNKIISANSLAALKVKLDLT